MNERREPKGNVQYDVPKTLNQVHTAAAMVPKSTCKILSLVL